VGKEVLSKSDLKNAAKAVGQRRIEVEGRKRILRIRPDEITDKMIKETENPDPAKRRTHIGCRVI
jgi:hypothetical protein